MTMTILWKEAKSRGKTRRWFEAAKQWASDTACADANRYIGESPFGVDRGAAFNAKWESEYRRYYDAHLSVACESEVFDEFIGHYLTAKTTRETFQC